MTFVDIFAVSEMESYFMNCGRGGFCKGAFVRQSPEA